MLVSGVSDGLSDLKSRFEAHVHSQGVTTVQKCGEAASNVSMKMEFSGSGGGGCLVPRHSVIGEKSAWYPLFTHARAVPLHSPYNSSRYVS